MIRFKRILIVCLCIVAVTSCSPMSLKETTGPTLIINGEKNDSYTRAYSVTETFAIIPLETFLDVCGAIEAEYSAYNAYQLSCVQFMGHSYVIDYANHLFMLEEDYTNLLHELEKEGKKLSKYTTKGRSLFPDDEYTIINPPHYYLSWNGLFVDHVTLMNTLQTTGVDISIDSDYSAQTIDVIVSCQGDG